jgi:two-component system chemotaxis response regulator CheY
MEVTVSAKIMIVDDAAFMRKRIRNILTKEGYEIVAESSNGREAVDNYKQFKPELVTMDITMPEMDGISALQEIRSIDPMAMVIMVTAMGQQSMVIKAIKAGAKDFIVKPFEPERVITTIKKALMAREEQAASA